MINIFFPLEVVLIVFDWIVLCKIVDSLIFMYVRYCSGYLRQIIDRIVKLDVQQVCGDSTRDIFLLFLLRYIYLKSNLTNLFNV